MCLSDLNMIKFLLVGDFFTWHKSITCNKTHINWVKSIQDYKIKAFSLVASKRDIGGGLGYDPVRLGTIVKNCDRIQNFPS